MIAMSGGVDSSVAALLMQRDGYDCVGVMMQLPDGRTRMPEKAQGRAMARRDEEENAKEECPEEKGSVSAGTGGAASAAERLGIPLYVYDMRETFCREVIDRFVAEYEAGRTPNPCVLCNRHMKFDALQKRAEDLGCSLMVTGHYARVSFSEADGRWQLRRGKNRAKDQSYVLCFLSQDQLSRACFPLGEFESKEQIRDIARSFGLDNAEKHDSQDICFVPDGDYASFIERYTGRPAVPGDFTDPEGKVLGRHRGMIRYTIGQRKGLGLSLPAPLYVAAKDMALGRVILTPESGLYRRELNAEGFNWISVSPMEPGCSFRALAKTRYHAKDAPAVVTVRDENRLELLFDEPQRALTAGQAVVLYDETDPDLVIGGGTIS